MVYRLLGLKTNIFDSKSNAIGFCLGNKDEYDCLVRLASFKTNSLAWSLVTNERSSLLGVPTIEIIF